MKKTGFIFLTLIVLFSGYAQSQNINDSNFQFPNSKMGKFASIWFEFFNSGTTVEIKKYDKDDEWYDYFLTLRNLSKRVNGITPFLISYETEDFISIYSKGNEGAWVKVNLRLNRNNEITAIGIKKSVKPIDYVLKNKLTKEHVKDIVSSISDELRNNYVIQKYRTIYSDELMRLFHSGKYNSITQGDLLADVLTKDLVELSKDKHLQIIPPSRINEVQNRFGMEDSSVDAKNESHHNSGTDEPGKEEFISSKLLDNNIGFISINRFVDNEKTAIDTKNVFLKLSDSKAIIID